MSDNKNKNGYASLTGFKRAIPIILLALAAFTALCFITQQTGALGNIICQVLLGLFARGAYAIPVLLALHAIFFAADVAESRIVSRVVFSVTALLSISAVLYTVANFGTELTYSAVGFYNDGVNGIGGGLIGSTVAFGIIKIFGHVGLIIIAAVVLALYVSFFFAKGRGAAKRSFYGVLIALAKFGALIEKGILSLVGKAKARKKAKADRIAQERTDELFDDEFFAVDNGLKELSIPALGIRETRSDSSLEQNPTLQERVHHRSAEENFSQRADDAATRFDTDYGFEGGTASSASEPAESRFAPSGTQAVAESTAEREATVASERASLGLDCSADEIFTRDFSPIDFALDSEEANRPSTRTYYTPRAERPEIRETVSAISERDIEMARRKADFDMKRSAAFGTERDTAADARTAQPLHEEPASYEDLFREFSRPTADADVTETPIFTTQTVAYTEPTVQTPTPAAQTVAYTEPAVQTPAPEAQTVAYTEPAVQTHAPAVQNVAYTEPIVQTPAPAAQTVAYTEPAVQTPAHTEQTTFNFESSPITVLSENPTPESSRTDIGLSSSDSISVTSDSANSSAIENDNTVSIEATAEYTDTPAQEPVEISISRTMLSPNPDVIELLPDDSSPIVIASEEEEPSGEDMDNASDSDDRVAEPLEAEVQTKPAQSTATQNLYTYSDELGNEEIKIAREGAENNAPRVEKPEAKKPKRPDYSKYKFPSLDLLAKGASAVDDSLNEEMEENGNKIIETLASFDVLASIKGYDRGPRITRYEVVPGPKVRVNQVVNLFDDISLSLATEGIRIEAPIPGKSAIGFELPNKTPETVRLRDLLECDEFKNAPSKTLACIGKDVTGSPVFGDIAKMPHILIAGATGMGKSVCINSILISILYKARPDEVKFILIDPKKVEFKMYNDIPHLLVPVVSDPKQAAGALMWAVEEMERRYDVIESLNVRNIEGYNEKVRDNPTLGEPLPKLIIVIDELNDLMLQVRDPVEGLIMSISQKARAAGIHLIIGTQRPSVNVITGVIKANIPSRMSCKVASYTDSKTIIERAGAEKLLDKGDMLYHPVGTPKPIRVQSAFVSDSEVYAVMDALKENRDMVSYDDKVMEDISRAAQKCVKTKGGAAADRDSDEGGGGAADASSYMHDKQFLDAVDLAVSTGKISTSLIQRRIGVGYGKAAKFIDIMESMNIVSEPNGQKPRETLITREDWLERLANE